MTTIANRHAGHYHLHMYYMAPAADISSLTTIMDDANMDLLHKSNYWWRWRWVAVTSSLTTTIMAATINEVSSTKSLPANDRYYHRYQFASCWRVMYVYYIKVRYCNKELQLLLRRPAAHIIINNNNNIIINNNMAAAAINLLLSRTIDDGGGGGIYHHYQLATCSKELCRYIILRWDAAICNKESQLMRGSTINCHCGCRWWSPTWLVSVISPALLFRFDYNIDYVAQVMVL